MVYRSAEDPQISPHKKQNRKRSDDRHYSGAGCRDDEAAWELRARQDEGRKWALRLSSVFVARIQFTGQVQGQASFVWPQS